MDLTRTYEWEFDLEEYTMTKDVVEELSRQSENRQDMHGRRNHQGHYRRTYGYPPGNPPDGQPADGGQDH